MRESPDDKDDWSPDDKEDMEDEYIPSVDEIEKIIEGGRQNE